MVRFESRSMSSSQPHGLWQQMIAKAFEKLGPMRRCLLMKRTTISTKGCATVLETCHAGMDGN